MADSWIEPRTRIPFVGIVAMVLIVAVVAIFIKTQLAPLFPAAEVTVQDETSLVGKASDTYYGVREIPLQRKELLVGSLNRQQGPITFSVDAPNALLTITSRQPEEVELSSEEGVLKARFEHDALQAIVIIDAPGRTLTYSTEASMPITVALSEQVTYIGSFTNKGKQYDVTFYPGVNEVRIGTKNIALAQNGALLSGTWVDGRTSRPLTIDMEKGTLTVQDVY